MAAIDPDAFRLRYPAFADASKFPDAQVTQWGAIADLRLNAVRWADLLTHGRDLFVAHYLSLGYQSTRGAIPGQQAGAVQSKTVGPASVSYDTSAGINPGDGHWNLTTFGTQFVELVRLVGAGPLQP